MTVQQETKTELTARIAVRDTANVPRVVEEYTRFARVHELSGKWSPWRPGTRSFRCAGQRVNLLDDGNFHLASTGEALTRSDPA